MDMVMEETMMVKRNSLIFLTAFGLLLTGCSKSGLEITKDDILEVARDDANATKSECENVSIKEQKGSYIVSSGTSPKILPPILFDASENLPTKNFFAADVSPEANKR